MNLNQLSATPPPKTLTYTQPVTLNFTMPTHSNKIPAHTSENPIILGESTIFIIK